MIRLTRARAVSIHALVRVRRLRLVGDAASARFNPRTRESATVPRPPENVIRGVSIHALVRVRRIGYRAAGLVFQFQSTHS